MNSDTNIFSFKYVNYIVVLDGLRKEKTLLGFFVAVCLMIVLRIKLSRIRKLYAKGRISKDVFDIYITMLKGALKF